MKRIIHWFRRDLRVTDNTSLFHACNEGEEVIPIYILSTWKIFHPWTGANRQEFLCGTLRSLAGNLEILGGNLIIRSGDPIEELETLLKESRADSIFFNRAYDPFSVKIEANLEKMAHQHGATVQSFKDTTLFEHGEILTQSGTPFRVFTPYARAWHSREKPVLLPKIKRLNVPAAIASLPLPTLEHWRLQSEATIVEAGEKAARTRLKHFLNRSVRGYSEQRNLPAKNTTSRLSQDLRFGAISPRYVYFACRDACEGATAQERRSVNSFVNELVWREFYSQILANFPSVLERDFSDQFSGLPWDENPEALQRWSNGETGFPIVDAGMRELNATGFMHNRVRMITAMFLTKDLHIHWKEGEKYFMRKLVDGDIASNNGGWQWSAGTGADAAPYFRIQNPWTQTKNHDPDGTYIKKWIPELREVSPALFQNEVGARLSAGYPAPMVNHAKERLETLARFSKALQKR
jgi:deoxyribodipyrimidine photo-lyase